MKQKVCSLLFRLAFLSLFCVVSSATAEDIPVKGMVTMVDLGANRCVPCKLMAPIIEKLEHEYKGKAAIVFIDVWKNPDQAKKYGISTIPTQIFYDKNGKEQSRHVGFMSEVDIKKQLDTLLSK
jgi:thioredoxin 1